MALHGTAPPTAKPIQGRRAAAKNVAPTRLSNTGRGGVRSAVSVAEEKGLLQGRRTLIIRGRMPEKLVAEAKRKTGITSDSKLLEAALAHIAVADDYAAWLFSQRGSIHPDLDLEF